jgi:hypothetical protein
LEDTNRAWPLTRHWWIHASAQPHQAGPAVSQLCAHSQCRRQSALHVALAGEDLCSRKPCLPGNLQEPTTPLLPRYLAHTVSKKWQNRVSVLHSCLKMIVLGNRYGRMSYKSMLEIDPFSGACTIRLINHVENEEQCHSFPFLCAFHAIHPLKSQQRSSAIPENQPRMLDIMHRFWTFREVRHQTCVRKQPRRQEDPVARGLLVPFQYSP